MLSPPYSPNATGADDQPVPSSHRHRRLSKLPAELPTRVASLNSQSPTPASRPSSSNSSATSSTYGDDTDNDTDSDQSVSDKLVSNYRRSASAVQSSKRSALVAFDLSQNDSARTEDALSSDDAVSPTESDSSAKPGRERRMTTCWDALRQNPGKYLRLERSLLDMYPLRRHSWAGPGIASLNDDLSDSSSTTLRSTPPATTSSGVGRGRGRKPGRQPGSGRGRRRASIGSSDMAACGSPSPAATGQEVFTDNHWRNHNESGQFCTTKPHTSTNNSTTSLRVHDLSYNQLKDYSPCISLLPPGKSLRAEWKGAPMDLSGDPDLGLLHPAEAQLASVLRLPCDVYLDSKRRLFAEKVHRLKQGLPFRRTDSQKACRIDVNKASRLFGAFEKIGWLEDNLFMKYLDDK